MAFYNELYTEREQDDLREIRRQAVRNLWPQRRNPHCRRLLRSTLTDCRALERPHGRHCPVYREQLRVARARAG
jgi:hypothetical protein